MASGRRGLIFKIDGVQQLRSLSRDLKQQADGKRVNRQLVTELRRAVRPMARAAKAGALTLPSKEQNLRRGRPSLRAELSRAVSTQIKTTGKRAGVRVFVNPKRMPDGKKSLARYMEGVPGWQRWRHPVFGHDVWVRQQPHPFFTSATRPAEREARQAVNNVIDKMKRDLEHGA
jgi:hypothetical protein